MSFTSVKQGGARLLSVGDSRKKNPFGNQLVGWRRIKASLRSFANFRGGYACLWLVVQKLHQNVLRGIYEQPQIVENPGCVVICRLGDRYGLIESFRNTGPRIKVAGSNYVQSIEDEGRWNELASSLGESKWEIPAGISPAAEGADLKKIIRDSAKLEAAQEAGYKVGRVRILKGTPNFNPTFFVHFQYVVVAEIEVIGEQNIEDLEMIGKARLFTARQIRKLIDTGQLIDGRSMAAFTVAGIHIPV